ncbi:MAG: RND family efflux transporter MFP subunit [Myxococcota bacterium]
MNAEPTDVTVEAPGGLSRPAQLGLGFLVLLGGLGAAGAMIMLSSAEEQVAPEAEITPVEVVSALAAEHPVQIKATGTVIAARQVNVIPQVAGQLTFVSDELQPGGRFKEGEVIARIDSRDYRLAVDQQNSTIEQAQVELQIEQGRQKTARREWQLLGGEGEPPDIVARSPQLQAAEANLAGAKSRLASSQLSLQRTSLRAPFNAIVTAESAEVGQVVGSASIATLVGTDTLWVQVSIPVERLSTIQIPGYSAEAGSTATVTQALGTQTITRTGTVARLSGQLDDQSRTATLIVAVEDPLNLAAIADGKLPGLPLLPGAFVDVAITGSAPGPTYQIPRVAVEDHDHVWVAAEGSLSRRVVSIGWGTEDNVFVTSGLRDGEQVVTTPMSFPIEGMAVSVGGDR